MSTGNSLPAERLKTFLPTRHRNARFYVRNRSLKSALEIRRSIRRVANCGEATFSSARGGLEPALRVLFSAIFHGVSLGNFHQSSNLRKVAEEKL